jgi:hypothetical protein
MMTSMMKHHQALRALLLLGVALATTLTLLIGAALFHVPGLSPISFAHAKETGKAAIQAQSLCATTPNAQNCTNQDPVVQGCTKDAQTVAFKKIIDAQGNTLATLQRRYSPTCHSEWGRMTDDGKQPLSIIVNKNVRSTKGKVVFSATVFIPNLNVAPQIDGTVSTNGIDPTQGGSQGKEALIAALPPAQSQQ